MAKRPIPVVDLFAGPGGLGEGFSRVGDGKVFKTVISIEKDPFAIQTLRLRAFYRAWVKKGEPLPPAYLNLLRSETLSDRTEALSNLQDLKEWKEAEEEACNLELGKDNKDIHRLIGARLAGTKNWVLIGGPPCQAYSLVGRSRMQNHDGLKADHRHFLYKEYLAIIKTFKPAVFVMENVKGLNTARVDGKLILPKIVSDLENAGYELHQLVAPLRSKKNVNDLNFLIKAEEHGIPQTRHRVIIVGTRSDLKAKVPKIRRAGPSVSLEKMIGALPGLDGLDSSAPRISQGKRTGAQYVDTQDGKKGRPKDLRAKMPTGLKEFLNPKCKDLRYVVLNHEARAHMPSDLQRYQWWSATAKTFRPHRSPTIADIPDYEKARLLPKHANVANGKTQTFVDRFKVQVAKRPCGTITSHISKDGHYYIHYDPAQCRSFSVREAARVQTFPDDYFFMGNRTQQYHQVGNAVPPYLAYQIGNVIRDLLKS